MHRQVAKIAYEWYCLKNKVEDKYEDFSDIIAYILQISRHAALSASGKSGNDQYFHTRLLSALYDPDLRLQKNALRLHHPVLHLPDQRQNIPAGSSAPVYDKSGVLFRNLRAAHCQPF